MQDIKKTRRWLFLLVAFGILLHWLMQNIEKVAGVLGVVLGVAMPFIVGLFIAFILNMPMRFLERKLVEPLFKRLGILSMGLRRVVSLILTLLLMAGILSAIVILIVPEFSKTIGIIAKNVPVFLQNLRDWAQTTFETYPEIINELTSVQVDWESVGNTVFNFIRNGAGSFLNSTFSVASSIFSGIVTAVLGLFFSIYVLLQKERLGSQLTKIITAFLPGKAAEVIFKVASLSERTFSNFFSGQCTEAVILGLLFFVSMAVFRFPYALVVSVLIAVFALVPIFGAIIACVIGAFLILMVDPIKAIWFVVMFLIIQQIENNLIYPRVVGGSVGLPSIWVLVAVTVGGGLMGIVGMIINIPVCSVLYTLIREATYKRLAAAKEGAGCENLKPEGETDGTDTPAVDQ